jgi:hypothetical protein
MASLSVPTAKGEDISSVFDVINIFHHQWFLHQDHLIANALSAQKDSSGKLSWFDFQLAFHTSLVQCCQMLLPPLCPMAKRKKVMFVFLLEILNREGPDQWTFWKVLKKCCSPSLSHPTPSAPNLALSTASLIPFAQVIPTPWPEIPATAQKVVDDIAMKVADTSPPALVPAPSS